MEKPEQGLNNRQLVNWRLKEHDEDIKELKAGLASIMTLLRTVMGSLIVALILLVVNILIKTSAVDHLPSH